MCVYIYIFIKYMCMQHNVQNMFLQSGLTGRGYTFGSRHTFGNSPYSFRLAIAFRVSIAKGDQVPRSILWPLHAGQSDLQVGFLLTHPPLACAIRYQTLQSSIRPPVFGDPNGRPWAVGVHRWAGPNAARRCRRDVDEHHTSNTTLHSS